MYVYVCVFSEFWKIEIKTKVLEELPLKSLRVVNFSFFVSSYLCGHRYSLGW